MQPDVVTALNDWELEWDRVQKTAIKTLQTAFIPLARAKTPTYCCAITLEYDHADLGSGKLCLDDHGRVTIDFGDLPNGVIAEAMDAAFGIARFNGAEKALGECGPGTYSYDCETTGADFEVVLGTAEVGKFCANFVTVPDATVILDCLSTAAKRR
ncbi:hypothetical protein ACH4YO_42720 [Streptomyces noursei]|uniref:hypothetical protein n=1 Tax=Streptomyces noursei TaxID=1971 RepID=UPI0033F3CD72